MVIYYPYTIGVNARVNAWVRVWVKVRSVGDINVVTRFECLAISDSSPT